MVSLLPKDQFRTPATLFEPYHTMYDFTVDGMAGEVDHLLPRWWGPGGEHGDFFTTDSSHWLEERVWLNPPYSMIPEVLEKVVKHAADWSLVCILLPAWTDRKWFHKHIVHQLDSVCFLPKRVRFLNPDGSLPKNPPTFPSMVVAWYND